MRRFLALLQIICLLGLLPACGTESEKVEFENETTETQMAETKEFSRGTINGDVYSNQFIGISFTKPELWVYSTDEEIANLMGISAEVLEDGNFIMEASKLNTIYDMMVQDAMTGNNIIILEKKANIWSGLQLLL